MYVIYSENSFRNWFKTEYCFTLEIIYIKYKRFIYNMDKKTRICMPTGEEIIILIRIKEIYIGILENRLFIIVIESISTDRASIPPVIIIPGRMIITS
jgi:hypothetical protein